MRKSDSNSNQGSKKYRDTVFLPSTGFAMKADLSNREVEILAEWDNWNLVEKRREVSLGREIYCLHDGPPYANGHLHIGHAMNKILKDFVVRTRQMMGYDSRYIPGWDCHGLPIEWKVEENFISRSLEKSQVPIVEFRQACRNFAEEWIGVQRQEFKRMGISGDWDNFYTTMTGHAEATIAEEFLKFAENGALYRKTMPVMWSVAENTALAEAEIEYKQHSSQAVYVKFPVGDMLDTGGMGTSRMSLVIWTTTPWTLPMNQAVAFSSAVEYVVCRVNTVASHSELKVGEILILSRSLAKSVLDIAGCEDWSILMDFNPSDIRHCEHPFKYLSNSNMHWEYDIPVYDADFVNDSVGTGFVHIAPSHGVDDYHLGVAQGLKTDSDVTTGGTYVDSMPVFGGNAILTPEGKTGTANKNVIDNLRLLGMLIAEEEITHSYPHSWRSGTPLIYITTPQWFINIDHEVNTSGRKSSIREIALECIDKEVSWIPGSGRNRIYKMVESRPDWLVSRQRVWGVPMCCFTHRDTGELLRDATVNSRIVDALREHGSDIWFHKDNDYIFLGDDYRSDEWEKVPDILDVWFDSGATHSFVLRSSGEEGVWPASLYLEGTDQHRGWFHSSLLESCATYGHAPYKSVLTHGFVLDKNGEKMSKSRGNVVSPMDVINKYGADVLRLWVMQSDYTEDIRIGSKILQGTADAYRRIRNTIRYLLAALNNFSEEERVDHSEIKGIDKCMLHRIAEMDAMVRECYTNFRFQKLFGQLFGFCSSDLSSFYFDVKKDVLYCGHVSSFERRSYRTILDNLFNCIIKWFAPILVFTTDEAWKCRDSSHGSIHIENIPDIPSSWYDGRMGEVWTSVRQIRQAFDCEIERMKSEGTLKSSLEATVEVKLSKHMQSLLEDINFEEICMASKSYTLPLETDMQEGVEEANIEIGFSVSVGLMSGEKCARCRKFFQSDFVGDIDDLCDRCQKNVSMAT